MIPEPLPTLPVKGREKKLVQLRGIFFLIWREDEMKHPYPFTLSFSILTFTFLLLILWALLALAASLSKARLALYLIVWSHNPKP